MKTILAIIALSFATAASAQSFWPFIPNHERLREVPRQNEVCTDKLDWKIEDHLLLTVSVDSKPQQIVRTCFMVDPATNVPQPTPAQKLLRRM